MQSKWFALRVVQHLPLSLIDIERELLALIFLHEVLQSENNIELGYDIVIMAQIPETRADIEVDGNAFIAHFATRLVEEREST